MALDLVEKTGQGGLPEDDYDDNFVRDTWMGNYPEFYCLKRITEKKIVG